MKCIKPSLSGSIGLPLTNSINKNTILLPSKAGIGSRLKNPKLILINPNKYNKLYMPSLAATPTS